MAYDNQEYDTTELILYGFIVVGLLVLLFAMWWWFSTPAGKQNSSTGGCPTCPDEVSCPDCPSCPDEVSCPDCPSCPDPQPGSTLWKRYNGINAVWGLGGVPKDNSGMTFSSPPPVGVKLYGRFDSPDDCEQKCKDDQPFCNTWALHPADAGVYNKTCYGINDTHLRGVPQSNMMSGQRINVLP
jgi:hypothetical protein